MTRRVVALGLAWALLLSACGATSTSTPASGGPAATETPAGSTPGGTAGPGPTGSPGAVEPPTSAALPLPTMTEPFEIGGALYDPTSMGVAVVSLLELMRVGIYARDGTPIRRGAEHAAGDPWLFEGEVRGLIDMGIEDILAGDDEGGLPFTFAALYDALASAFDRPMSRSDFVAAYADAYADHPDDLVPQVLLGQPLEASTPLTRVQLWLLLMDGFVGPPAGTTGYAPPGSRTAQVSGVHRWGTAMDSLPGVSPPIGMSEEDWRELMAHLPTLPETIDFRTIAPDIVPEGVGGPGTPVTARATVSRARPLVSPLTGHVLLEARTDSLAGLAITWRSEDVGVLQSHGSLSAPVPATMATDAAGSVEITYAPIAEAANGQGLLARDFASLYATADRLALVEGVYFLSAGMAAILGTASWMGGLVTARGGGFTIQWHAPGIEVRIENDFNIDIDIALGFSARAHRLGKDVFEGVLTKRGDGKWRGTFKGFIGGPASGVPVAGARQDSFRLVLPLAEGQCEISYTGRQDLLVVGEEVPTGFIDADLEVLHAGAWGSQDLVLRFYPASDPRGSNAACLGELIFPFEGPPCGCASQYYAAFNDTRFTSPVGFGIHVPDSGQLEYADVRQDGPGLGLDGSIFQVEVTRSPGA